MTFLEVSKIFQNLETTSSRNEMSALLVEAIKLLDAIDLQIFSYLVQGRVAPMFVPAEFNLSEKGLLNSLKAVYGEEVLSQRSVSGDLGLVVEKLVTEKTDKLSLQEVYSILWEFVNAQGKGSVELKSALFLSTIKRLSPVEAKYFTRIILGSLRLGCSTRTLLDAFSTYILGGKGFRSELDRAYGSSADVGYIGSLIKGKDAQTSIKSVRPLPGVPIMSRLVERVKNFDELSTRFKGSFLVQPKYDGLRCQIHKISNQHKGVAQRIWYGRKRVESNMDMFNTESQSEIRLFTRNLEDITDMFPEIVMAASKIKEDSFILDSEIVGFNAEAKRFLSYQDTMTRRRKYGVEERKEIVPVNAFIFDIMHLNDRSLLEVATRDRFEALITLSKGFNDGLQLSPCDFLSKTEEVRPIFNKYVDMGLEGIIIKDLDGSYSPGVRNFEWIKVKKSVDSSMIDTVDLVVLGYYYGSGKRSKFGIGAILGGVYNPELERFESVTKVGTGITDVQFGTIKERLDTFKSNECPKGVVVEDILKPDVYTIPKVVITVDADEISINRSGEAVARGLSLRFPRLIEFDRDKNPEDVTTVDELYSMVKGRQ
ncbi:ATP-dependent DNA ligase [Candidatus Dojkabacteria bacterium]|nr:ATP-dependent DNA ligase [Candidatus Dojkabacteria bacterium]